MRLCTTVIFTDKLAEVRAFYLENFKHFPAHTTNPNTFSIMPFAEAQLTWVDAASASMPITLNTMIRISVQYILIERAQLVAQGVVCSELIIEDWGAFHGKAVQYFSVTDPSGTRLLYYEDHYGENRQLMTTGDGTGTREVQKAEHTPD